jgi:flavin-dependent dehydrogenase
MPDAAARPDRALPVAVIGAGPVGLAAAAHLVARGLPALVLEAGPGPGHAVRQWGHVRMFSPWGFNTDPAARALLEAMGWQTPEPDDYPTGTDLAARYVEPLATALAAAGVDLRFGARVVGVSRRHQDRLRDGNVAAGLGRAAAPFVLHVTVSDGSIGEVEARAVIDASGTWTSPNPAGAHGPTCPSSANSASGSTRRCRRRPRWRR